MSWFTDLSSTALTAFDIARQSVDKVLDIEEEPATKPAVMGAGAVKKASDAAVDRVSTGTAPVRKASDAVVDKPSADPAVVRPSLVTPKKDVVSRTEGVVLCTGWLCSSDLFLHFQSHH